MPSLVAGLIESLAQLTVSRDREFLDQGLVRLLGEVSGAQRVALHRLAVSATSHWLSRVQWGLRPEEVWAQPISADLHGCPRVEERPAWRDCLLSGQPVLASEPGGSSLLPLQVEGQRVAVIELIHHAAWADSKVALTRAVLRVLENHLGLLDYSERDSLTGLQNRKSFDDSFYRASALPLSILANPGHERRRGEPLCYWLAVIDIDHFKLVNDRFGHLIGDEVLLLLSQLMRHSFRHIDQLFRFGGEEFVVLLCCANEEDAMAAVQRFRLAVRNFSFPQVERVTISIGFTKVKVGDTPGAAVERADKAVYLAKHRGRDLALSYAALVRAGALAEEDKPSSVEFF